jgi:hypothetical protein
VLHDDLLYPLADVTHVPNLMLDARLARWSVHMPQLDSCFVRSDVCGPDEGQLQPPPASLSSPKSRSGYHTSNAFASARQDAEVPFYSLDRIYGVNKIPA